MRLLDNVARQLDGASKGELVTAKDPEREPPSTTFDVELGQLAREV